MTSKPAAPPGIGVRGRRFWSAVMARYEPTIAETEILREAARTLDELDALEAAVRKDGAAVSGSKGQRRSHPGLAELRALRAQLVDLLGSLSFNAADEVASLASVRARKAAESRWSHAKGGRRHAPS